MVALSFVLRIGSRLYLASSFSRVRILAAIYSFVASNEVRTDDKAPEVSEKRKTPPIIMNMQKILSLVSQA